MRYHGSDIVSGGDITGILGEANGHSAPLQKYIELPENIEATIQY